LGFFKLTFKKTSLKKYSRQDYPPPPQQWAAVAIDLGGAATLSPMTFCITALSRTTISINKRSMTFSITSFIFKAIWNVVMLSVVYVECHKILLCCVSFC
jgi:hypothetical protein